MKPSIYFRVDGDDGKKIGLGHVTRCLKIYKELKISYKSKYNFFFLIKNFYDGKKFLKFQTNEKIIEFNKKNLKKIEFKKNDVIIIDTLGIESDFLLYLKKSKLKKIFSFEDVKINLRNITIINGIFFAKRKLKKKLGSVIFQGPKYVVLDKNFSQKKSITPLSKKINFLVSSGGGDKKNFMFYVCKILDNIKNIKVIVIIGKAVKKDNPIFKYKNNKKFILKSNRNNIYNFFSKSNISIVSGGTVMFESICTGTKTLVGQTYSNQKFAVNYFLKKKLISKIADFRNIKIHKVHEEIDFLMNNENKKKLFNRQIREIDGKGLMRIINIIKKKL